MACQSIGPMMIVGPPRVHWNATTFGSAAEEKLRFDRVICDSLLAILPLLRGSKATLASMQ